jgi:hypothetical protein
MSIVIQGKKNMVISSMGQRTNVEWQQRRAAINPTITAYET